jgi:hypothetical protein
MGYRKDLGRQWKLGKHLILENFQENEPESTHVASTRVPIVGFRRETNQASWKSIPSSIFRRSWQRQNRKSHLWCDLHLSPISRDFWQRFQEQIRCSYKIIVLVYEDTSTQRGYHSVWWLARGSKHRKGPYSEPNQRVLAEVIWRKERTLRKKPSETKKKSR